MVKYSDESSCSLSYYKLSPVLCILISLLKILIVPTLKCTPRKDFRRVTLRTNQTHVQRGTVVSTRYDASVRYPGDMNARDRNDASVPDVFSTSGECKRVSVAEERNFRAARCVQRWPREKALFKGGREVLKDAKEGVSPSIKKALNASAGNTAHSTRRNPR